MGVCPHHDFPGAGKPFLKHDDMADAGAAVVELPDSVLAGELPHGAVVFHRLDGGGRAVVIDDENHPVRIPNFRIDDVAEILDDQAGVVVVDHGLVDADVDDLARADGRLAAASGENVFSQGSHAFSLTQTCTARTC